MYRKGYFAALAAGLVLSACGGGSPNAAGGAAGEEMQAETQADGYPNIRQDASGGSVSGSDSTAGYMNSATGATGGGSTGGTSHR